MTSVTAGKTAQSSTRRIQAVLLGMLFTIVAAAGVSAWAQTPPPHPPMAGPDGPGMKPGWRGMHEGMRGMHGGMMFGGSPERMGRMIDHVLDGLNASDAQRTQIKQIAATAAADLKAQAAAGKGLREKGMMAFAAPTVDAAAVEQVRLQMLAQHDAMSKRVSKAMLDIANVLTPEQRAKIAMRLMDRRASMEDRMKRMDHDAPHR